MGIKLPRYQSLNNEQLKVIEYDSNKNLAVYGGPGTGKSILALYKMHYGSTKKSILLTYSKNLAEYIVQSENEVKKELKSLSSAKVNTFDSFFGLFLSQKESDINAQIEADNSFHEIKDEIAKKLSSKVQYNNYLFDQLLIIDEAQDLSQDSHNFLKQISKSTLVFADENQTIVDNSKTSTKNQLNKIYNTIDNEIYLTENYRNTKEIYNFARLFNVEPKSNQQTFVRKGNIKPRIIEKSSDKEIIGSIVNVIENNPTKSIGVFIPYLRDIEAWNITHEIENTLDDIDKERVSKKFGKSSKRNELKFSENNVHFLTFNTTKGLEYDIVLITDAYGDLFRSETKSNVTKSYVAFTRARDELIIFYSKSILKDLYREKSFLMDIANKNQDVVTIER